MPARFLSYLAFILILASRITGLSQHVQFRHYSSDEGFTGASFKTIVQDSLGFLWVASASGLYKFDGYHFIAYRAKTKDSLSIPQEIVNHIWVDPFGRLWAGFPDALSLYDRDLDGFRTYRLSLSGREPETMWFENEKVVWLGAPGKGLVRFDIPRRKTTVFPNQHNVSSMQAARNTIREIKDDGESLLLGTAKGLWRYNKEKKSYARPV